MPTALDEVQDVQLTADELVEVEVTEDQLRASICRDSFYEFTKEFITEVIPDDIRWNWHIEYICNELQEIAERVFKGQPIKHDLICNISPGTTKSTIFTVLFPAWVWTRMIHAKFICVSYAEQLALNLSRLGRDIVTSDKYRKYFPEIEIRDDQATKHMWCNTKGGERFTAGSRGTTTGMHGHFIIIDDPINPEKAISRKEMALTNHWIKHTLSSRLTRKGVSVTILVMQRLAIDDPTGLISKRKKIKWIKLPANTDYEINPPELVSYYTDGYMDPVGLSKEYCDEMKDPVTGIGEEGFDAQYGQAPVPLGGGMFKTNKIGWGPEPEKYKIIVRGWDKAITPEPGTGLLKGPAFSVGFKMAQDDEGNIWFLDIKRKRMDSAERERLIKDTAIRDGRGVIVGQEQEPGSGGKESAQNTAKRLMGFRVISLGVSGSKEARADAFSSAVNNGICHIPDRFREGNEWIGWAAVLIDEMMHWPYSTFLDQVDAGAVAYNIIAQGRTQVGGLVNRRREN